MHFSILDKSMFVYCMPREDLWTSLTIHCLARSAWSVANGALGDCCTHYRHFNGMYFSSGKCQFVKVNLDKTLFLRKKKTQMFFSSLDNQCITGMGEVAAGWHMPQGGQSVVTGMGCRASPSVRNEFIMNNVIGIDTAQGLFLILNND